MSSRPAKNVKKALSVRQSVFTVATVLVVLIVASLIYWHNTLGLGTLLPGDRDEVITHWQLWRLLTSILIHQDHIHLIGNSVLLIIFGYLLCRNHGLLAFPLLPLTVSIVANYVELLTYVQRAAPFGASGMVSFMGAFWFTMLCFTKTEYSVFKRFLICAFVIAFFLHPPRTNSHVDYRGHLIGAIFGFTAAVIFFAKNKKRLRSRAAKA